MSFSKEVLRTGEIIRMDQVDECLEPDASNYHDTVATCQSQKQDKHRRRNPRKPQNKHPQNSRLLPPSNLQPPNLMNRQDNDKQVLQNIRDRAPKEEVLPRQTRPRLHERFIRLRHGLTLENNNQDNGDPPEQNGRPQDMDAPFHGPGGEDAVVHGQDGGLDDGYHGEVEVFADVEVLGVLVDCFFFQIQG